MAARQSVAWHVAPGADRALTHGPRRGRRPTSGTRCRIISELKTRPNENSSKNSYKLRKIPGKFVEEEDVIVNNFCNYNFLRLSMDLELLERFQVKAGLTIFVHT
jgi:hypothetical protein